MAQKKLFELMKIGLDDLLEGLHYDLHVGLPQSLNPILKSPEVPKNDFEVSV